MKTVVWKVSFKQGYSEYQYVNVIAPNVRSAIQKALSKTKGCYYNSLQYISGIEKVVTVR